MAGSIRVEGVSKRFRLYHERPRSFKEMLVRRRKRVYDEFWALRDVSFEVHPGQSVGLIGANGSGKSTLLKCLAGILKPEEGRTVVDGKIGALLEVGAGFHPELTGRENVYLNGSILGLSRAEIRSRFDEIVEFADLEDFIDTPVKAYSSGMYVRLGFAIAVNVRPDILLVDEVLAVGDEQFQRKCLAKFEQMRAEGRTIVLVTHALDTVKAMCDRAVYLRKGRVAHVGEAHEVVDEYLTSVGEVTNREQGMILEGQRFGTRQVEITAVECLGPDDTPGSPIIAGRPMTIRLHWLAHEPVDDAEFRVDFWAHVNGVRIAEHTTRLSRTPVGRLAGEGTTELRVGDVPLVPGIYALSVAIQNRDGTRDYDHHDRRHHFTVEPGDDDRGAGVLALPVTWEITQKVSP